VGLVNLVVPQMSKVSIVILCHKQSQYLSEAIMSAIGQTHNNVEIIVACGDEGSSDVARAWQVKLGLSAPIVLEYLDRGRSHAMNMAAEKSAGDYILRLDADDILAPNCVEKMLTMLPADIVGCDFQEFGTSSRRWSRTWDTLPLEVEKESNGLPCTSLVSRTLYEIVGGYDVALFGHEDWAFWVKCLKAGAVVRRIPEPLFFYRRHAGQTLMVHDTVLTSMIRLLHPDLYDTETRDREVVQGACDEVKGWIRQRAKWFPNDQNAIFFERLIK
jgi:glycosyltransferase involved in cell wall biosynthesis